MYDAFFARTRMDPSLNRDFTTMLAACGLPNPAAQVIPLFAPIITGSPRLFDGSENIQFMPLDATITNTLVITDARRALFIMGGTQGTTHFPVLFQSWNETTVRGRPRQAAQCFNQAAIAISGRLAVPLAPTIDKIFCIGHSYGGAVACALAKFLSALYPVGVFSIRTFGQPRPGDGGFQAVMNGYDLLRWWDIDDPVRYVPPHSDEVPALLRCLPRALSNGMNLQAQVSPGFSISPFGTIRQSEGVVRGDQGTAMDLGAWLTGVQAFGSPKHAISIYQGDFAAAVAAQVIPDPPVAPVNPDEPLILTRPRAAPILAQADLDLREIAANPQDQPPVEIVPQPRTSNAQRYERRRDGRVWVVELNGEVVAVGPGKRRAGILARQFNRAAGFQR